MPIMTKLVLWTILPFFPWFKRCQHLAGGCKLTTKRMPVNKRPKRARITIWSSSKNLLLHFIKSTHTTVTTSLLSNLLGSVLPSFFLYFWVFDIKISRNIIQLHIHSLLEKPKSTKTTIYGEKKTTSEIPTIQITTKMKL